MPTFKKKWFNPLYFILKDLIKDNTIRTILVYGGKSSSKTVTLCQLLSMEAYMKKSSSIAFRKHNNLIKTTLKKSFDLAIESTRLGEAFESLDFMYRTSDAEIVMKGLDNEEKAKGVESYKYLYVDELNHFTQDEWRQFGLSLRGIEGQKLFASWNPVDQDSWVKKKLIDKYEWVDTCYKLPCENSFVKRSTCGKVVLIKTTYEDNYWINGSPCGTYGYRDENLIAEYNDLRMFDQNSYNVNVLGEWGEIKVGESPFATQWVDAKHISEEPKYDPKKQLIISIDFNLTPFCVTFHHFFQDEKGLHGHQFDEMEIKQGSIPAMIEAIKTRYLVSLPNAILTGDAMGNRGDISQRDNGSLYLQLLRGLGMREAQLKSSNNPTHENSRADTNYVLYHFPDFKIHKNCVNSIRDMRNVQVDAFGGILKKDRKDVNQRADYIDTIRYLIHNIYYKWIENNQRR